MPRPAASPRQPGRVVLRAAAADPRQRGDGITGKHGSTRPINPNEWHFPRVDVYPLTQGVRLDTGVHMGTSSLTDTQENILAFMVRHQEQHARPPSLREICDEFGFASHNAARKHVQALARRNLVSQSGDGRSWTANNVKEVQGYLFTVPVFGTIPAGLPSDNVASADEIVRIDPAAYRLRSGRGLFALHVRGDSMVDAQIADGDIALLRNAPAEPGQIVAALIDGQTTLKRVIRNGRKTFLRAENKRYRDLIPSESLVIQGVLVGVVGRGKR